MKLLFSKVKNMLCFNSWYNVNKDFLTTQNMLNLKVWMHFWLNVVLFFWIKFITVIIWNDDMNFKEYILHIDMHFKSCLPVWRNILINWIGRIRVLGMKEDILILVWLMFCLEYNDDNDEMDDGTKNGSKALFWKLLIKSKID